MTGAVRAVPSFLFGAWLYGMRRSVWTIPYASVGFWGGLLGFVVGCGLGLPLPGLLLLYLTVTFAVAADGRAAPPCRLVRWAAAGGQLTYSSYILHELLMTVIVTFGAEHVLHLHGTWKNAVVVLTFLLVWPVSYVSLFVFEKPLRRAIGARAGAPALGLGRLSALSVKPGREAWSPSSIRFEPGATMAYRCGDIARGLRPSAPAARGWRRPIQACRREASASTATMPLTTSKTGPNQASAAAARARKKRPCSA